MHGQIETKGELTTGATVFDRRPAGSKRPNMEVVVSANQGAVKQKILDGLTRLGGR